MESSVLATLLGVGAVEGFELVIRGISMDVLGVGELLELYGSPLYVYDGDRLRETIEYISRAVAYPGTQFRFASVTNGNVALLQIFRAAGWGLHANTPGDIYLGLKAGFTADQIVYSGSNLSAIEMRQVLRW